MTDFKALQEVARKNLDAGMLKFQPGFREIRGKMMKSGRKLRLSRYIVNF